MSWNNGYETRCFNEENKKRVHLCNELNMPSSETKVYCGSYYSEHLNNRNEAEHTQPLDSFSEGMEEEGRNRLLKRYLEQISVEMEPDHSNPFWWIDTLENEGLIRAISFLTEEEKMLLTLVDINDYTLEEACGYFGYTAQGLYFWKEKVYAKIRVLIEETQKQPHLKKKNAVELCLCKRCAKVLFDSKDHYIVRREPSQKSHAPCQVCLYQYGYDFWIQNVRFPKKMANPRFEDKQPVKVQSACEGRTE